MDKYVGFLESKSERALRTKITSQEAQIEDLKAKARPEGPDTTPKSAASTKRYSELTFEERQAMSHAEVDALLARQ